MISNKKIVKHWLMSAYGEIDNNYEDYLDRLESWDLVWKKDKIKVEYIQTHHDGHDASEEYISEYIEKFKKGSKFPPIIVKKINDGLYLTIDGQHRVKAAEDLNEEFIDAFVGETTESFEERKDDFKKKYSLHFIKNDMRVSEDKAIDVQLKLYKFIEENYTETKPHSSNYLNNNPYSFFSWWLENHYDSN